MMLIVTGCMVIWTCISEDLGCVKRAILYGQFILKWKFFMWNENTPARDRPICLFSVNNKFINCHDTSVVLITMLSVGTL